MVKNLDMVVLHYITADYYSFFHHTIKMEIRLWFD